MRIRSHHIDPRVDSARVIFAYKNFAACKGISHIGLGVAASCTAKVLRAAGYWADVWPVINAADLVKRIADAQASARLSGEVPITHLVISAAWLTGADMMSLARLHPEISIAMILHSNIGFLSADANAFAILRDGLNLARSTHNFEIGGNTRRFTAWLDRTYRTRSLLLPNLYDCDSFAPHVRAYQRGDALRIGCFGAARVLKNIVTGAAAALQIASELGAELEFFVSTGRDDARGVLAPIRQMFAGHPRCSISENGWQSWPDFRRTVGSMHLLLQPSFTESFNMVSADGVAEGVPTVASSAIDWVPRRWIADADDAGDMARVGVSLLHDAHAVQEGRDALTSYVHSGIERYRSFLLRRR